MGLGRVALIASTTASTRWPPWTAGTSQGSRCSASTPRCPFTFSDDNPIDIPADATPNQSDSVAAGYWIMLAPLSASVRSMNF